MNDDLNVMSITEAGRILGISPDTLHRQSALGRIEIIRLGPRTAVIRREEVERYRRESSGKRGRPRKS